MCGAFVAQVVGHAMRRRWPVHGLGFARALLGALFATLMVAFAPPGFAQDVLAVPPLSARVIDQTETLRPEQRAALEAKLQALETELGSQIVVLMVPSTAPEDIASYAHRVADTWKIGRREVGDGLLIVVAKDDRRVRIEVAKALEGAIPDLMARRVIDQAIVPAFRAGDYHRGLDQAIDRIAGLIRGEGLPAPSGSPAGADEGTQWSDLLIFLLVGAPVISAVLTGLLGRKLGSMATGGAVGVLGWWFTASLAIALGVALFAWLFTLVLGTGAAPGSRVRRGHHGGPPIIWGGGGWGGGGGGGGFSSGGGGDFGGGGASGDW